MECNIYCMVFLMFTLSFSGCDNSPTTSTEEPSSAEIYKGDLGTCCEKLSEAVKSADKFEDWEDTTHGHFTLDNGKLFEIKKYVQEGGFEQSQYELVINCPFCGTYIQAKE